MANARFKEVQGKDFAIVVEAYDTAKAYNLTKSFFASQLRSYARKEGFVFYGILHDFDIAEDGNLKRPHYHLVLSYQKRHRIGAIIKKVSFMLGVSEVCVSVIKSSDVIRDVRYLIHLDEDGLKTAYPADDIITNDDKFVEYALMHEDDDIKPEELFEIIRSCGFDRLNIMKSMGFKKYNRHRNCINDLLRDYHV